MAFGKWIRVKERLPQRDQQVLFCGRLGKGLREMCRGAYNSPAWQDLEPTHWMDSPDFPDEYGGERRRNG
ncbi:hypothetical protein LCGC14_1161250 [marine sediment metagenome]|uniref:DUF551 domain-containing protein n=1 Tax=marine sediment metagenome TaxID=412755 RepID=A0A0F9LSE7_9ZZZZ